MNPKMNAANFGSRLKEVRELFGWSQQVLADLSGLTNAAISQIESGKREPGLKTIVKLLGATRVTFESLVKEKNKK